MKTKLLLSFITLTTLCSAAKADNALRFSARADIDGDGAIDTLRLKANDQDTHFQISVNNANYVGDTVDTADGFFLLDLARRDKTKAIVVHSTGPGGGESFVLLNYANKKIREILSNDGTVESDGRGTLRVETLDHGFWTRIDTYKWRGNRLVLVPQKFWTLDIKATTKSSLILRAAPHSAKTVTTLPIGRAVTLEKADGKDWFQVRSGGGSRGWISLQQVYDSLDGIPMSG